MSLVAWCTLPAAPIGFSEWVALYRQGAPLLVCASEAERVTDFPPHRRATFLGTRQNYCKKGPKQNEKLSYDATETFHDHIPKAISPKT
jgi:hypothetical protein